MKIACIRSTVRMTNPMVRTRLTLIWKLRATIVQPFGRQGNIVRKQLKSGKNFYKFWKVDRTVVCPEALCLSSGWHLSNSANFAKCCCCAELKSILGVDPRVKDSIEDLFK
jgi:hypothetical protein